jgi:DNA invertase Pin-like site-specific DNA recombinase
LSGSTDTTGESIPCQIGVQKQFDMLVFWSLDRLSREGIVTTLGYLEQLRSWGIGWRSYTQPFLDTGNEMVSGIVLSVLAAGARQERVTISERTKAGLVRARRAGKTLGRPVVSVDLAKVKSYDVRDWVYGLSRSG